ncbi:hypothetical protein AAVH_39081, partial [Aphelenchoides avenae]
MRDSTIYAIAEADVHYEMASTTTGSAATDNSNIPFVRNPAPHRGFNNKAREVLLDPPAKYGELAHCAKFCERNAAEEPGHRA